MPIFEYRCPECKTQVEEFFRSLEEAQDAVVYCQDCPGQIEMEQLFPLIQNRACFYSYNYLKARNFKQSDNRGKRKGMDVL